jgi:hypothetical protein
LDTRLQLWDTAGELHDLVHGEAPWDIELTEHEPYVEWQRQADAVEEKLFEEGEALAFHRDLRSTVETLDAQVNEIKERVGALVDGGGDDA